MAFPAAAFALVVALALGASPPAAAAEGWRWPVGGPVVQRFRVVADRFARGQHRGIDLAAGMGASVRSACAGRVSFAGVVPGGGRTVSVRCGALTATYQRLAAIAVRRGASLAAGARLGAAGASALHFGVHRSADRHAYLDPLSLLGGGASLPRPPVAVGARRPSADPLGPPPLPARARSPHPAARPAIGRREGDRVPLVAWVGAGLAVLALPGWEARRRRRRHAPAATRRLASSASRSQSA